MNTVEDLNKTSEEAYAMAFSVALQTLNHIMVDENSSTSERLWAAEAVLENPPKNSVKTKETTKENED